MSHRTVREPTDEEHDQLKRMKRQEVGRVSVRAHIILLGSRGYSAPKIAEFHDVTGPMVYKWMDRFDEEGPSGLYDRERDGRPKKITEEVEEEIEALLEGNPTDEGENATRWTQRIGLQNTSKESLTSTSILRRSATPWVGWSTAGHAPRRKLPPVDPEACRERIQAIVEAIGEAGPGATVLIEDETEVKRFPPLRRQSRPAGEQRPVMVPDGNEDFTLYGTLDLTSGRTCIEAYEKGRSDYTIEHLKSLLQRTVGQVILVWDQATWHTSRKVRQWLGDQGRIETYLLPVRSPETNPMEDLWRELKEQVAACLERSLEALLESCQQYFDDLSGENTLRTAGLYQN